MKSITREMLAAYLDDALSDAESNRVEQALRQSDTLRQQLAALHQERDRGEHSVGAIWRRERLTCLTREQLGSYLLKVLDAGLQDYAAFHLDTVACPFCLANLADLKGQQAEATPAKTRQKRYFDSSAGLLKK
ncbi:MAG: hypothetical protein U0793_15775 [Gemmataceae bacterium]